MLNRFIIAKMMCTTSDVNFSFGC